MITLVAACSKNRVIGKDNKLPWHLPEDLKHFKSLTLDRVILMGRKTFESLGNKLLPGRVNIIITRNKDWQYEGATRADSIPDAIAKADALGYKELFIAGGGDIYRQALPLADTIYITRIHATLEGDTFFPVIPANEWEKIKAVDFFKDEKHAYDFTIETWIKQL